MIYHLIVIAKIHYQKGEINMNCHQTIGFTRNSSNILTKEEIQIVNKKSDSPLYNKQNIRDTTGKEEINDSKNWNPSIK